MIEEWLKEWSDDGADCQNISVKKAREQEVSDRRVHRE